jgi:hypothetical protein
MPIPVIATVAPMLWGVWRMRRVDAALQAASQGTTNGSTFCGC